MERDPKGRHDPEERVGEPEVDDTREILEALGEDEIAAPTAPPRRRQTKTVNVPGGALPARGLARPHGTPRPRPPKRPAPELRSMLERDVEVRCLNGGLYRGRLIGLTPENLLIERHSGQLALLQRAAVIAVLDENFGAAP